MARARPRRDTAAHCPRRRGFAPPFGTIPQLPCRGLPYDYMRLYPAGCTPALHPESHPEAAGQGKESQTRQTTLPNPP